MPKVKLPVTSISLKLISIVFAVVILLLAFGKLEIIPFEIANLYIESSILMFGFFVLFIETFREKKFKLKENMTVLSFYLSIITLIVVFSLAMSKILNMEIPLISGGEWAIFLALGIFIVYEVFISK